MNIQEIRKKYPQYDKKSDQELAKGFYDKFYKNKLSFDDFSNKIGLSLKENQDEEKLPLLESVKSMASDVHNTLKGVQRGFTAGLSDPMEAGFKSLIKGTKFIDEAKDVEEERLKFQGKYPIVSGVSDLAGAIAMPSGMVAKGVTRAIPLLSKAPKALKAIGRVTGEVLPFTLGEQIAKSSRGEGFDTGDLLGKTAGGAALGGVLAGVAKGGIGTTKWLNRVRIDKDITADRLTRIAKNRDATAVINRVASYNKEFSRKISNKASEARRNLTYSLDKKLSTSFGRDYVNIDNKYSNALGKYNDVKSNLGQRVITNKNNFMASFKNFTDDEIKMLNKTIEKGITSTERKAMPELIRLGDGTTRFTNPTENITLNSISHTKQNLDDLITGFAKNENNIDRKVAESAKEKIMKHYPKELKIADKELSSVKRLQDLYDAALVTSSSGDAFKKIGNFNYKNIIKNDLDKLTATEKRVILQGLRDNLRAKVVSSEIDSKVQQNILGYETLIKKVMPEKKATELMETLNRDRKAYNNLLTIHAVSDHTSQKVGSNLIEAGAKAKSELFGTGAAYFLNPVVLGGSIGGGLIKNIAAKGAYTRRGEQLLKSADFLPRSKTADSVTNSLLSPAPLIRALSEYNTQERK